MKNRITLVLLGLTFFGVISINHCEKVQVNQISQDDDAIKFVDEDFVPEYREIVNGNELLPNGIPIITERSILHPPPIADCRPCFKLDPRGKCRPILGCKPS